MFCAGEPPIQIIKGPLQGNDGNIISTDSGMAQIY